jgi:hypothetical protein
MLLSAPRPRKRLANLRRAELGLWAVEAGSTRARVNHHE